jgi:hypothetical protein
VTSILVNVSFLRELVLNKCPSQLYPPAFATLIMQGSSYFFFQWIFQPIQGPGLLFSSLIIFPDGRTPWTNDQPVARPLPKHRITQTQNKRIHTPNIHALSGIRTHDPSVLAGEDT